MNDKEYILKSSLISDLDGKFGYPVEEDGVYRVNIKASGYKPLEKFLNLKKGDEIIEEVALEKDGNGVSVASDIEKIRRYQKIETARVINGVIFLLIVLGFIFNLLNAVSDPTFFNLLIFILYSLILVINLVIFFKRNRRLSKAKILDQNKNPISSAVVKVYNNDKQVGVYVTNSSGEFKANLTSGEYKIMISKSNVVLGDRMYKVFVNKSGYIVDDVVIQTKYPNLDKNNIVTNPFS